MGLGRREPARATSYISTGDSNELAIRAWIRQRQRRLPPSLLLPPVLPPTFIFLH
uniref:Uncharacterized protein n=1 Tax=Triticum urartu TaxID=4572 RepID=A0A8R7U5J1_TRIUA